MASWGRALERGRLVAPAVRDSQLRGSRDNATGPSVEVVVLCGSQAAKAPPAWSPWLTHLDVQCDRGRGNGDCGSARPQPQAVWRAPLPADKPPWSIVGGGCKLGVGGVPGRRRRYGGTASTGRGARGSAPPCSASGQRREGAAAAACPSLTGRVPEAGVCCAVAVDRVGADADDARPVRACGGVDRLICPVDGLLRGGLRIGC
jgi:hypothetical protein